MPRLGFSKPPSLHSSPVFCIESRKSSRQLQLHLFHHHSHSQSPPSQGEADASVAAARDDMAGVGWLLEGSGLRGLAALKMWLYDKTSEDTGMHSDTAAPGMVWLYPNTTLLPCNV